MRQQAIKEKEKERREHYQKQRDTAKDERTKIREKVKKVFFKSLRNSKSRNKGNFKLKSNSNKILLFEGGGHHHLIFNKIST